MSRRKVNAPVPVVLPLRVNDLLFITEYLKNGRNGTQAYLKVHPFAKSDSARANAPAILAKASVQAEIARRIKYEGGITRELVESNLLTALQLANDAKDAAVISSVSMDCAKLAGFLIERREVKTLSDGESDAIKSLVAASLRPITNTENGQRYSPPVSAATSTPTLTREAESATVPATSQQQVSEAVAQANAATPHPTAGSG